MFTIFTTFTTFTTPLTTRMGLSAVAALAIAAPLLGCSQEAQGPQQEILDNLVAAGFPADDLEVKDGLVLTGGDAVVSLAASREMLQTAGGPHEQYRSINQMGPDVHVVCVDDHAFTGVFSGAMARALENYNALALSFRLRRGAGPAEGCDATITANLFDGTGGAAGFPANGSPFNHIDIGRLIPDVYPIEVLEHVITHELGHCIGLRHSDYYNRSISCNRGGNEGPESEGVVHVPGTPTEAVVGGSLMNACYRATETGNFSATDLVTLDLLYGSRLTWAPAVVALRDLSDVMGWGSPRARWASIAYADLNGDGSAEVCGRSAGLGLLCADSFAGGFLPMLPRASSFTDLGGWSAESNWATIAYPDLNGDGKADVCGRSAQGLVCGLSSGLVFSSQTLWTSHYSDALGWGADRSRWGTIRFQDLNRDGKADVCGRSLAGIECALSTGTSFGPATLWTASFSDAEGWNASESYWGTIQYADVTGDGRADVCGRNSAGLRCARSLASEFGSTSPWSNAFSDASGWGADRSRWGTLRLLDVDADGRKDVCGRSSLGIQCARSTGAGFLTPSLWSAEYSDAGGWASSESYWGTIDFPDLNGDALPDVCGRRADGVLCAISNAAAFIRPALRSLAFSDAAGWRDHESQWRTLRYPDQNGDRGADACGRTPGGLVCAR